MNFQLTRITRLFNLKNFALTKDVHIFVRNIVHIIYYYANNDIIRFQKGYKAIT